MISKLNLVFINKSKKNIKINHIGDNLYFKNEFQFIIIDITAHVSVLDVKCPNSFIE